MYRIIYDADRQQIAAWLIPNDQSVTNRDLDKYLTSVDEIEKRTGLDFLNLLDDALQADLEGNISNSDWIK